MNITEETALEAGKAAADAYRHWRNTTEVQNLSVLVAQVADAVINRAAPLIAAQALREAAKSLDDAAAGAVELAKRESHDGSGANAYAGGLYAAAARLGVRAGELLADCGEPYRVDIPDAP